VFGSSASSVFTPSNVRRRAAVAWRQANEERAEQELALLVPIGLHECRHSWVSWLHDAAVPFERVSDYAGHAAASSVVTERYRHRLAGQREEDVKTMDAYLLRVTGAQAAETA
jgi:integrase